MVDNRRVVSGVRTEPSETESTRTPATLGRVVRNAKARRQTDGPDINRHAALPYRHVSVEHGAEGVRRRRIGDDGKPAVA